MSKKTHGTQTNLSHFRRDNETQYTLPLPRKDGSMPGKGTQTGISKGTNVARTTRYIGGLRGARGPTQLAVSALTIDSIVTHGSNPPLNEQYQRWDVKAGATAAADTKSSAQPIGKYEIKSSSKAGARVTAATAAAGVAVAGAVAAVASASGSVAVSQTTATDEKYDAADADDGEEDGMAMDGGAEEDTSYSVEPPPPQPVAPEPAGDDEDEEDLDPNAPTAASPMFR